MLDKENGNDNRSSAVSPNRISFGFSAAQQKSGSSMGAKKMIFGWFRRDPTKGMSAAQKDAYENYIGLLDMADEERDAAEDLESKGLDDEAKWWSDWADEHEKRAKKLLKKLRKTE